MVRYAPKDMDAVLASIHNDNDRSVALVGASMLEYSLQEVIKSRLRQFDPQDGNADLERLFGINGIFSGLSSKIVGGYAMQLFGPLVRRDLELINKIRNEFAHDMNPVHFSDDHIKSRCREIQISNADSSIPKQNDDPRGMYILAISLLSGMLGLRAYELHPGIKDEPDAAEAVSKLFSFWLDK
jgi:hypothetical protein